MSQLGITKVVSLLPHSMEAMKGSGVRHQDEEMIKIHQELHNRKRMNLLYKLYQLRKSEVKKGAADQGLDPNTYQSFINYSSVQNIKKVSENPDPSNFRHLAAMSISSNQQVNFFNST